MSETSMPPVQTWLASPVGPEVSEAIERLRRAPDVQKIAVMPDVHLAADVCVGVVVATSHLIYPQAVGGDIGCGMLAVALDLDSSVLRAPSVAGQVLAELGHAVPARRRNRRLIIPQPESVANDRLSHPVLDSVRRKEGEIEFATLGSGNHFVEVQSDEDARLWLMVHSGSRALGQAIRDYHLRRAEPVGNGLRALDAKSSAGEDYLHDASCARRFADASRRAIAQEVGRVLHRTLGAQVDWDMLITTDHNHVSLEYHGGRDLWVHRKGAMPARLGEAGVLPGSMGSLSFHVEGRGCEAALCSSAHGAGRVLSRAAARQQVTERALRRQMEGVWYDSRKTDCLRDEAPSAYKDIRAVLRAQKDMVKVTRTLRPVLNYKGL
ncbi:MAG: RtcB family protein [Bryobacterales bacterium]|nr:RtcB family protein [Bryobacterales bacterium]